MRYLDIGSWDIRSDFYRCILGHGMLGNGMLGGMWGHGMLGGMWGHGMLRGMWGHGMLGYDTCLGYDMLPSTCM